MRDIGDDPTVERTASLGNAFWQVQSVDRSLDTYNCEFSARRVITERVGLELEYTGRYNSPNYDAQQLMIGVAGKNCVIKNGAGCSSLRPALPFPSVCGESASDPFNRRDSLKNAKKTSL